MNQQAQKPFAVFDIDGTLIRWQLYHAVTDTLVKLGYFDAAVYDEVKQARMLWKQRTGEESFKEYEQRLVSAFQAMLTTLTVEQFNEAAELVFDEYKDQVYRYTRNLIRQLRDDGYLLFAISGSMTEIVGKIADYYGFDDFIGAQYAQENGRFTGERTTTIGTKHTVLQQLIAKHNATLVGSIAVGDSEGDITLLSVVEQPIAMNPTKQLFVEARAKGWKIVVERKNMIYRLEPHDGNYRLV